MKKVAEKKKLTPEQCDEYLNTYKKDYLAKWEKGVRFLLDYDETKVTTLQKRESYAAIEQKLRGYLPSMSKIHQDAAIYLKNINKKLAKNPEYEVYFTDFMAVQIQCTYYEYQLRKILITICRWYYEEPDKKTTLEQRLQMLAAEWEALKQFYYKNKEVILDANLKEERQFAEMEDDLAISMKVYKGEVLSPVEKILRTAELSRDSQGSDRLFVQAMEIAETDEMRYWILKKRTRYHILRENRQIGNGFYKKNLETDNAGMQYIAYMGERAKEKIALLTKINTTGKYDLDELDVAQDIFSFFKVANIFLQLAIAKKNHEERLRLIQLLKDFKDITHALAQKHPLLSIEATSLEDAYFARKDEWQREKELMAQKEMDAKTDEVYQQKLRDEYEAAFSKTLAELGYAEVTKKKKNEKKKRMEEALEADEKESLPEQVLIEETALVAPEMHANEAVTLLNQAEIHKKNAENILNRQGAVREAVVEFESAKSALQEALDVFNEKYADDKVLKEAILLVLAHTDCLLQETIEKLAARVEKLNVARTSARQYIIETYGMEAWYKDTKMGIRELSQHAKERITAIHNLNRLQALQQGVEDLKNSQALHLATIVQRFEETAPNILQLNSTRREVREHFRFFRSHCPPENPARKLSRSYSVDSFLSPEQTAARGFIKKVYGW